ncbi:MAG TPA: hypothetical protein VN213_07810, partial [Solirubrobacteraceae bacterium]|nr:hypothetical protein [Solirubrobacteraceae bacterium]
AAGLLLGDEVAAEAQRQIAPGLEPARDRAERETGVPFLSPGGVAQAIDTGIDAIGDAAGALGRLLGGADEANARERARVTPMRFPELRQEINLRIGDRVVTRVVTRDVLNEAARKGISPHVGGQTIGPGGKRGF